jgi:hypothetical protein
LVFYATEQTLRAIKEVHKKHHIEAEFKEFSDWEDFLVLSRDIKGDDNLIIVMSRKNRPSYDDNMPKIPKYLNKYFQTNNFMLIFPTQIGVSEETVIDDFKNPSMLEPIKENIGRLDSIGKSISGLFKRKK